MSQLFAIIFELIILFFFFRRWVDLSERNPPVALVLSSVFFGADSKKNLLNEPVIVANVLSTPSVEEGFDVIYSSATNELRINGTGFMGAKKVDLYFTPPLVKEVAYEDVTKYPLQRDQVVLRLRHNYNWRDDAGPLTVVGVDTGGGPVKLGEFFLCCCVDYYNAWLHHFVPYISHLFTDSINSQARTE